MSNNGEGYILNSSGRKIPFDKPLNVMGLSKKEIDELYDTPANLMEVWRLRNNVHEIRNELQKISTSNGLLLEAVEEIRESLKKSEKLESCPRNKTAVKNIALSVLRESKVDGTESKDILDKTVSELISNKVDKVIERQTKFMKWVTLLVIMLAGIGYFVVSIKMNIPK